MEVPRINQPEEIGAPDWFCEEQLPKGANPLGKG
jgi:hypothetical protein